jgi:hypothetical protein
VLAAIIGCDTATNQIHLDRSLLRPIDLRVVVLGRKKTKDPKIWLSWLNNDAVPCASMHDYIGMPDIHAYSRTSVQLDILEVGLR